MDGNGCTLDLSGIEKLPPNTPFYGLFGVTPSTTTPTKIDVSVIIKNLSVINSSQGNTIPLSPDGDYGSGTFIICNQQCSSISISNCYINGNITANGTITANGVDNFGGGGFIGSHCCGGTSNSISISNCYITGTITANANGGGGGFIGRNCCYGTSNSISIIDCYITGNITANGGVVGVGGGGFIGGYCCRDVTSNSIIISNCYINGNITANGNFGGGGFIGGNCCRDTSTNSIIISNCYINGTITANGNVGVVGGGFIGSYCCLGNTSSNSITITDSFISTENVNGNGNGNVNTLNMCGDNCTLNIIYTINNDNQPTQKTAFSLSYIIYGNTVKQQLDYIFFSIGCWLPVYNKLPILLAYTGNNILLTLNESNMKLLPLPQQINPEIFDVVPLHPQNNSQPFTGNGIIMKLSDMSCYPNIVSDNNIPYEIYYSHSLPNQILFYYPDIVTDTITLYIGKTIPNNTLTNDLSLENDFIKLYGDFNGNGYTLTCKSSPFHNSTQNRKITNVKVNFKDNLKTAYNDYITNKPSTFSHMLLRHGSVGIVNNIFVNSEIESDNVLSSTSNLSGYTTTTVSGVTILNNDNMGTLAYQSGNTENISLTIMPQQMSKNITKIVLSPGGSRFTPPLVLTYQYKQIYPVYVSPKLNGIQLTQTTINNMPPNSYNYNQLTGQLTISISHFSELILYTHLSKLAMFKCGTKISTKSGNVSIENLRGGVVLKDKSVVTSVDLYVGKCKCKYIKSEKLLMSNIISTRKKCVRKIVKDNFYVLTTNKSGSKVIANDVKCILP